MRKIFAALLVTASLLVAAPVGAAGGPQPFADAEFDAAETDAVAPILDANARSIAALDEFSGDPLRLVVWPNDVRRYSQGTDQIGVYVCTWAGATFGVNLANATMTLNNQVNSYFLGLSDGDYNPTFIARTTVTTQANSFNDCAAKMSAAANPLWGDSAAIGVLDNQFNAGLGGPGLYCNNCESLSSTTFPTNSRWAVVDGGSLKAGSWGPEHITTAAHEIGHTISFPHSYSGETVDEYDNPIDFMSGNMPSELLGRADDPYASLAFNRYRAGWVDPADVVIYDGGITEMTLAPVGIPGTQMVILPSDYEYAFVALDARLSSVLDPIPANFEGVSAHYIEQWCKAFPEAAALPCGGLSSRPYSYPPSPNALDHVTAVGTEATFDLNQGEQLIAHGTILKVLAETAEGLTIKLIGFDDVASSVFLTDILWLGDSGITKGCDNNSYCPTDFVTRGQMAAFLVRALGYTDAGDGNLFIDDDGDIFEDAIDKLATAGVTKGCNPPDNTMFCPNDLVTREQMAAFLVRALNLTDDGGGNTFIDDDGSVFEDAIAKLATAGITKGCNPPDNTMFCPGSRVTREQMAAFLKRALS
ncbi:MAG: S-layer homology domain-containing protein [Actinomycetota bacterium]|nr:S-layer homology domain-containing protein [Actinomycetota bacterium]